MTSSFVRKNQVFLLVLLFLVLRLLLRNILDSSEQDVLVLAKHYIDKSYIENDWYLNLGISYRYLFNYFAGALALVLPLPLVSITGRILMYLVYAYLIQEYARHFDLKPIYIVPFLFLYTRFPNIVAGNRILGGLDTKLFSYFFLLLAVLRFMQGRYFHTNLFLGLGISFHILVGGYAAFSLLLAFLINYRYFRGEVKRIFKHIYILLVAAGFGLYAVFQNIIENTGVDKSAAGQIFVKMRVPHHTYPAYWQMYEGNLWIVKLALTLLFLFAVFRVLKEKRYRVASGFALSSSAFFGVGLLLFWCGNVNLLKFFWFRLPDVLLPFFSFFLAFALLSRFDSSILAKLKTKIPGMPLSRIYAASFAVLSAVFVAVAAVDFSRSLVGISKQGQYFYIADLDPELRDMLVWIRTKTDKNGLFLVNPFIDKFYIAAERPMFVSFRHSAESERDILEWHRRIQLCNNNEPLHELGARNEEQVTSNFYTLEESSVREIGRQNGLTHCLGRTESLYSFPVEYRNSRYALYLIR
jgi:hypothetical protein